MAEGKYNLGTDVLGYAANTIRTCLTRPPTKRGPEAGAASRRALGATFPATLLGRADEVLG